MSCDKGPGSCEAPGPYAVAALGVAQQLATYLVQAAAGTMGSLGAVNGVGASKPLKQSRIATGGIRKNAHPQNSDGSSITRCVSQKET